MNPLHITIEDNRISLTLFDGPLPYGMSTHEAKKFAADRFFGGLVTEVKRLAEMGSTGEIVLQVREALEVR